MRCSSANRGQKFSPAGPKTLQKRAAKGLKIGGHGCNVNIKIIKFPRTPPPRDRISWQVVYGWGLGVAGRGMITARSDGQTRTHNVVLYPAPVTMVVAGHIMLLPSKGFRGFKMARHHHRDLRSILHPSILLLRSSSRCWVQNTSP